MEAQTLFVLLKKEVIRSVGFYSEREQIEPKRLFRKFDGALLRKMSASKNISPDIAKKYSIKISYPKNQLKKIFNLSP